MREKPRKETFLIQTFRAYYYYSNAKASIAGG